MSPHRQRVGGRPVLGIALAAASALCYAVMPLMARRAYDAGATPFSLLSLRFLFAVPIFWGALFLVGREGLRAISWRRAPFFLFIGGLFGTASVCMFQAYHLTDVSLAVILLYTYPPLVGIWARIWFKERLGKRGWAALLLAFLGVALASGLRFGALAGQGTAGVLFALVAGLIFSCYSLLAQREVARTGPLPFTAFTITGAFILVSLVSPPLPAWRAANREVVLMAALMAVVTTFMATYLYVKGIKFAGATRAGLASNVEPAATLVFAHFMLGDPFAPARILGGALILAGVVIFETRPVGAKRIDSRTQKADNPP